MMVVPRLGLVSHAWHVVGSFLLNKKNKTIAKDSNLCIVDLSWYPEAYADQLQSQTKETPRPVIAANYTQFELS
jgi:inosine/xanthosine triphosphate pyrophosphatase family protein